jgi:DUF971 family protein
MANQGTGIPKTIEIQHDDVSIIWDDGHTSTYPHRYLRLECHCASCVGEWPNKGDLDPETIPMDVYAMEYQTIGRYAVQFLWSDGHYTGLYPYDGLRKACPCPECTASKQQA